MAASGDKSEAHSDSTQTSKIKFFEYIVNSWKPLTILQRKVQQLLQIATAHHVLMREIFTTRIKINFQVLPVWPISCQWFLSI